MTETLFVCRENELARLDGFLDEAIAGHGRVAFITGEPGSGKTALMRAFTRQAQVRVPLLIVAEGLCNDQSGIGEPYLPFREVLATLVGGLKLKLEQDQIAKTNSERIKKIAAQSGLLLLEVAPTLVNLFVPQLALAGILGTQALKQYGLGASLQETAKKKTAAHALLDASLNQENVFEQYTQYILKLSKEAPLLINIDDMQWADPSSLGLLFHLGRRLGDHRVLVLCSYRQDEVAMGVGGERHPLEKIQTEFLRLFGDNTLVLNPDNTPEDRRLVDAILDSQPNWLGPDFRQALCHHTEGNPLFVRELVQAMQERGDLVRNRAGYLEAGPSLDWSKLPARVQGVIQERIDRLTEGLRQTLNIASIQGEQFVAEIIASLQQVAERELIAHLSGDLSRRYQLVAAVGSERMQGRRISMYRFSHNLLQKYLYQKMDPIELSYLHEDIGVLLEQFYAGVLEQVAVELAWHFSQAGVPEKAARYALLAGQQAMDGYAYQEALRHLTLGLEQAAPDDHPLRFHLIQAREQVYSRQGKRQPQWLDLEALAELAPRSGEPGAALDVQLRQVQYHLETADYPRAQSLAQAAIDQASQIGDSEAELRGYALLGRILFHQSDYGQAREWLELAEASARENGNDPLLARTTYDLGMVDYFQGRFPAAIERYQQAQALYVEQGNEKGQVNCLLMQGTVHAVQAAYIPAQQALERGLERCRRIGWRRGETYLLGNLGGIALNLGQLEEAQRRYEWSLEICREVGDREGESISLDAIGLAKLYLGFPEQALVSLREALKIGKEIGYQRGQAFVQTHLGQVQLELNLFTEAVESFQAAIAMRKNIDAHPAQLIDSQAGLAAAYQQVGDLPAALERARLALNGLAEYGPEQVEYPVLVYLQCLRVLQSAGDPDAELALRSGVGLLKQQAGAIQDDELRRTFLERVPFNRELLAEEN